MPISQHPGLRLATNFFTIIAIGFGINALLRPAHALTFFEWERPTTIKEQQLVDSLVYVYGVRDIFSGLTMYISSAYGTRRSSGWTMVAASGVAFADGLICWSWGKGEWGHWSYAPVLTVAGLALLGVFDRT